VLTALRGDELSGSMLVAAQDEFFAPEPVSGAAEMAERLRRRISEIDGMTVDREPVEMTISGSRFTRLDFSGVGLFRAMLITRSRCHFVSFNLTTADPEERERAARSLDGLSLDGQLDGAAAMPVCIKDYITPEHLLSRIEPIAAAPKFTTVPVRIIVGTDGMVRHAHVVRGSAEQIQSITTALAGWLFTPPTMEGRPVEVETGITFRF
jgi:hypothetical protein